MIERERGKKKEKGERTETGKGWSISSIYNMIGQLNYIYVIFKKFILELTLESLKRRGRLNILREGLP